MKDLSTVTLPSGKVVTFEETNGLGVIRAIQMAKQKEQVPFAMACVEMKVDGKPVIFEDFVMWGSKDFMAAVAAHEAWSNPEVAAELEAAGGNLLGATPAAAPAALPAPEALEAPKAEAGDLPSAGALPQGISSFSGSTESGMES